MNSSTRTPSSDRGFTLIEVVIGIFIASVVLISVYRVAVGCLQLSQDVVDRQQSEMQLSSLLGVLRRNIEDVPGNAKITMAPPDGQRSEIVFEDYPLAFSWAGVPSGSKRILLISEQDPRGGTQIRIQYLNEEEAEEHAQRGQIADDAGLSLTLMDGLRAVRWDYWNIRTEEWQTEWEQENERPAFMRMAIDFYDEKLDELTSVFWLPVVVNPEVVARTQAGQRAATRQPGAGGGDGGGGGNPQVNPGPGGGGGPGGGRDNFRRPGGGGRPQGGTSFRPGGGPGRGR